MAKHKPNHYHEPADYERASLALEAVMLMELFEYAMTASTIREKVIRGFTARVAQMLKSIRLLWCEGDYDSCSILLRCMLERLLTLGHLRDTDEFEQFEEWSFYWQCQYLDKTWAVVGRSESRGVAGFDRTEEETERFKKLSKQPPKWRRPRAEDMAKRMNLEPLYHFCYDSNSTHVHPLANDGLRDFYSLTRLEPSPTFPDTRQVLHNGILIALVLTQTGMTESGLRWRGLLNDFVEGMMIFLETGDHAYAEPFLKLGLLFRDGTTLSGV